MRVPLLLSLGLAAIIAHGQITLEHTYPDAGFFHVNGVQRGQVYLLDFEVGQQRYAVVDRNTKTITLYNLDHTEDHHFSFSQAPERSGQWYIMYLSQNLFDTDAGIEYLYFADDGSGNAITAVYNEDGTALLEAPNETPYVFSTAPQQQLPIYNTSEGTKLILSVQDGSTHVYSLGGTLSGGLAVHENVAFSGVPFLRMRPNPTTDMLSFDYELGPSVVSAQIEILDAQGRQVKQMTAPVHGTTFTISVQDLPAGHYHALLRTDQGLMGAGEFVRVR